MSHLLIVEDDVSIADMYRYKLEQHGHIVDWASNGREGLILAKNNLPKLILLDIRMPVMSGDEMLKALRATKWGINIQVIVLTNISRSEAPPSLRFLNVERYVIKAHSTPKQVSEIVNEVLASRLHVEQALSAT